MSRKNFQPELFISVGEHHNFYTLRETYLHTIYIRGEGDMGGAVVNGVYQGTVQTEVRSFHHFNLSTDADEAFAKATECALEMTLPLATHSADEVRQQMEAIRRATAEELKAREEARAAQEQAWAEERAARREKAEEDLGEGRISMGRHEGKRIEDLSPGYLAWMVSKEEEFEPGSFNRLMARTIREKFAHLLPRKPLPDLHVGSEGKRQVFSVEVLRVHSFLRPKYNASWLTETVWIVTMITPEGACLVSKGTSFCAQEGEKLTIKATVKEHSWYNDQAQTVVQRIVVQE
mgnify:CR=1 FL=1